jgi:hypothetical protein
MKTITPLILVFAFLLQGCQTMKDPEFWRAMSAGMNGQTYAPQTQTYSPQPVVTPAASGSPFHQLEGAKIVAQDGTFLGIITSNKYDTKSICNRYGDHGSKYSASSIWNQYGDYGSPYAEFSPWNPYSSKPPLILAVDGTRYLLTKNTVLGGLDPSLLKGIVESITE